MEFNEKLVKLRGRHGMTQAELAEALNVSRQAVSKWERGITAPSTKKLVSMGKLFGVPLDELAGGKLFAREEPAAPETETPETETPETETPETEAPDAAPEATESVEAEEPEPVKRPQTLKIAGAAALAGCILLTGISIGIAIGVTVLKEPEKPSDSLVIISQDDLEWEDIDLTEVINMSEEDSGIIFTKSDKE